MPMAFTSLDMDDVADIDLALFLEMAARYGAETSVLEWRDRLVCSRCAGREIDMGSAGPSADRDQSSQN
jgi:hypothetical protein